jgi:hypothetical protein
VRAHRLTEGSNIVENRRKHDEPANPFKAKYMFQGPPLPNMGESTQTMCRKRNSPVQQQYCKILNNCECRTKHLCVTREIFKHFLRDGVPCGPPFHTAALLPSTRQRRRVSDKRVKAQSVVRHHKETPFPNSPGLP